MGCAKNLVDSEVLMRHLDEDRFSVVFEPPKPDGLDIAIINTCGFIGDAKTESIDTILRFSQAKMKGNIGKLFVMGCLSERYREQLATEIPEVDGFFGVNELRQILQRIGSTYHTGVGIERHLTTPGHYAYLKIAEGCNRKCSFCAIPGIRGPHLSRPFDELLREAEWLISKGVKEINLVSQDTTWYGMDTTGKKMLPELAERIAELPGLGWLRIQYAYPGGFPVKLLDVMANHEKICRYIDMPLQHISDRILRSMKRATGSLQTRKLLDSIRNRLPGVAIRTTFITGYPGETIQEFRELRDFIEEQQFDRVGVFTYSEEESTPAARLRDDVSLPVKNRRRDALMDIQANISLRKNRSLIGKKITVLIDRVEGEFLAGRTESDAPEVDNEVLIRADENKNLIGTFRTVTITNAETYDLYAVLD